MDHTQYIASKYFDLNLSIALCGILLVVLTISACSGDPSNSYSITIEHLPFEKVEPDSEDSINYSSATVSFKRVDIGETNEEVLSELMSSPFHNGKVKLRGQIEQPMWVEVLVDSDASNKTLSTRTFVEPGERISLAVIEGKSLYIPDTIAHVGRLSNVQDPSKKFSLVGDISSSNDDFLQTIAYLETQFWNEKGQRDWKIFSFVVVQDGKFIIEMEVEEPMILSVYVSGIHSLRTHGMVIAEPGTKILFQPSKHSVQTSANLTTGWFQARQDPSQNPQYESTVDITGSERHARLFDSWQKSFTYRLIAKQHRDAVEEFEILSAEMEAMRPIVEDTNELQFEDNVSSPTTTSWVKTNPAEGCEHINISQVRLDRRDLPGDPRRSRVTESMYEMHGIRLATLNDIARRARDPLDSLLALEQWPFDSTQQRREAIEIFDRISPLVSQDIADNRIAPFRKYLSSVLESEENEYHTVPGQMAPDFELPDIHGISQRFSNILEESDLVFMKFHRWGQNYSISDSVASLHDTYSEAGLQIVEVLFDVESDEKQELASNQDIAWIQLFDSNILSRSEVAKSYTIVHRNLDFLVDTQGCIVQRNLDTEDLRDYLNSYFDISTSTE